MVRAGTESRCRCSAARRHSSSVCVADIGQGVNAALLDVSTLTNCMAKSPQDLNAALREYEAIRVGENRALVRMMQVRTADLCAPFLHAGVFPACMLRIIACGVQYRVVSALLRRSQARVAAACRSEWIITARSTVPGCATDRCHAGAACMVLLWCSMHGAALVQHAWCCSGAVCMVPLWCSMHGAALPHSGPSSRDVLNSMQFAAPYQYKQAGMKLKSALWGANAALRLLLSKVLPQLFAAPVALSFSTGSAEHRGPLDTLYRDTLAAGNRTTRNLMVLLGVVVAGIAVICSPLV